MLLSVFLRLRFLIRAMARTICLHPEISEVHSGSRDQIWINPWKLMSDFQSGVLSFAFVPRFQNVDKQRCKCEVMIDLAPAPACHSY